MKIFMPCASVAGLGISAALEGVTLSLVFASLDAFRLDTGLSLLGTLTELLKRRVGYIVASQIPPPIASILPPMASTYPLDAEALVDIRIAGNTPRW